MTVRTPAERSGHTDSLSSAAMPPLMAESLGRSVLGGEGEGARGRL